jgi:hypothetical protein
LIDDEVREHSAVIETVAHNLRIDAATAQVIRALDAESISSLLLKGPVTRAWLYADGTPRMYLDSDLLVSPEQVQAAAEVLTRLGFERQLADERLPDWWQSHEIVWVRASDATCVDLHRSIPGIGLEPSAAWQVLAASADTIEVGGHTARTLDAPARALQLALHAAQHGRLPSRALVDLERGLEQCPFELWQEAWLLAQRIEATDAFVAGLRLTEAGARLADRLELPAPSSVEVVLAASFPHAGGLTVAQLAGAGPGRRVAIMLRTLVPPAAYMRVWAPASADSRLALARAYVRRPFWVLRRAPRALRAYRDARRVVNEERVR